MAALTPREKRDLIAGTNALSGTPTVETAEFKAGLIPPIKDSDYRPGTFCTPSYDRSLARKIRSRTTP